METILPVHFMVIIRFYQLRLAIQDEIVVEPKRWLCSQLQKRTSWWEAYCPSWCDMEGVSLALSSNM